MKLEMLFSRRSDGRIQEWTIEVEGDKFRTISGLTDGKKVVSEWTVAIAKSVGRSNATTPESQAVAEAKAKWQKQIDKGYSTTQGAIDKHGLFKPMLAKTYGDRPIVFPVYTQPKLDGVRSIAKHSGLWSRRGKLFTGTPHITEVLAEYVNKNPHTIFDGELYADKLNDDFNKIISFVKSQTPSEEEKKLAREGIQYHVYDFPSAGGVFSERSRKLREAIEEINSPYIVFVDTYLVQDQEALDSLYGLFVEGGYEGQIIRLDGPYENKRSFNLLKRKEFIEEEFAIVDILEGVGNRSGMAAKMVFVQEEGKVFEAGIKGTRSYFRKLLAEKDSLLGEMATVKYFRRTPANKPRFGVVKAIRNYE